MGAATMTAQLREITVNGERRQVAAETLARAIDELGYLGLTVATALNGDFVPAGQRAATVLKGGDRIEIDSARQGG